MDKARRIFLFKRNSKNGAGMPPTQSSIQKYSSLISINDDLFVAAVDILMETGNGTASISMIQRRLRVGYARSACLIDLMEQHGIVSSFDESKSRRILIKNHEWEEVRKYIIAKQEESKADMESGVDMSAPDFVTSTSIMDGMDGQEFEHFSAWLLRKNGFCDLKITPSSGDQGVDILAKKDGIKYAIQCKSYASPLGNTPVQEVNAGKQFYNCHVGVVMTNSTFTAGANTLAEVTGVLLWDRSVIQKMMIEAHKA